MSLVGFAPSLVLVGIISNAIERYLLQITPEDRFSRDNLLLHREPVPKA